MSRRRSFSSPPLPDIDHYRCVLQLSQREYIFEFRGGDLMSLGPGVIEKAKFCDLQLSQVKLFFSKVHG